MNPTTPDKRIDGQMRGIFVRAFNLLEPFLTDSGTFMSMAHEYQALQVMHKEFPDLESNRMFALIAHICVARAAGRRPV